MGSGAVSGFSAGLSDVQLIMLSTHKAQIMMVFDLDLIIFLESRKSG